MAPLCLSVSASSSVATVRPRTAASVSVLSAAPIVPARLVRVRATPTEEGLQSEENPFDVPQTGRKSPMSEDKHADTPEQMAAPEGDKAIEGQKWQPTKQDGQTVEDRYGSKEAYEQAMEDHKDKTKKSELQTGDMDGDYGRGGA